MRVTAVSVTLQEVADLAGVSIGTASQALNQRPNVALGTRRRVFEAARSLGYPLRTNGEGEEEQAISLVGMLVKHDFDAPVEVNAFYSHVQAGVDRACRRHQINLMYATIEVDHSNRPLAWPALVHERELDGLLLVGTLIDDALDFMQALATPVVLIDAYAPNAHFDTVLMDNTQGTQLALEHLIAHGHRHIALVGYNPNSPPSFQERYEAYLQTLRRHQIEATYVAHSFHSMRSAYAATQALLKAEPQVTAIFGCMDLAAIGALNGARDLGINVPGELSIIGFDNIDLASEIRPALTTVHVHKNWMGMIGVRHLLERVRNPEQPPTKTLVATHLVERETVAHVRK